MLRSGSPGDATPPEPSRFRQPPERLRAGSRGRPAAATAVVVGVVTLLAWRPWAPAGPLNGPTPSPSRPTAGADAAGPTSVPVAGGATAPSRLGSPDPSLYVSILDNQWTVVALVTPYQPVSTEEPATPHNRPARWSQAGPFLVLQQGLIPLAWPAEREGGATDICPPAGVPRDRNAVPLPAGRVAYIGVTVPGSVPRAHVAATIVGHPAGTLTRAPQPVVKLAGMDEGRSYVIPSAGPGGAVLFTGSTPGLLPAGTYRFAVTSPGATGNSYLYACVAP